MKLTFLFLIASFINSSMADTSASCNPAYSAFNRTYNATADECTVDSNKVVTSTSTCRCTGCQIQVYMAVRYEKCNNGTWSVAVEGCTDPDALHYDPTATQNDGSCVTAVYGCTEPTARNYFDGANTNDGSCVTDVPGCTDNDASNYDSTASQDDGSCVFVCDTFTCPSGYTLRSNPETISCAGNTCVGLATDHTNTSGTNYGQGDAKQDKDRCCYYNNNEFIYIEHTKDVDGTWKNAASGGSGCLSDKCYDKQQAGKNICMWGSGACSACAHCQANIVANVGYETKTGCDANCHKRAHAKTKGISRYNNFCHWSTCSQCNTCVAENTAGYETKTGCDANCPKRAYMKANGNSRYDDFCRWSTCSQCSACVTENKPGRRLRNTDKPGRRLRNTGVEFNIAKIEKDYLVLGHVDNIEKDYANLVLGHADNIEKDYLK